MFKLDIGNWDILEIYDFGVSRLVRVKATCYGFEHY